MADIKNDLSTNLVSYWSMSETSGTRYDAHGINHLTANGTGGIGYATGKIGNAADLERGDTDYFSIADASQSGLDITGDLTVSFWVKFESDLSSGTDCALFDKYAASGNQRGYSLAYENSSGTYRFIVRTSTNGTAVTYGYVNYSLTAGNWYHVVNIYDASAGTWDIYVNGSSAGTVSSLGTSLYNNTAAFKIGYNSEIAGAFDGLIDEVGIWSSALTSGNVTTLYNSGSGIPYLDATSVSGNTALATNLVSYWELEETTGTRVDSKGSNDLTAGGSLSYGTGVQGNAADFESGTSDYLYITDAAQSGLDIASDLTMAMWVKFESDTGGVHLMGKRDGGAAGSSERAYVLYKDGNTATSLDINISDGSTNTWKYVTWSPSTATWYHVAVTYDASAGSAKFYVNGVQLGATQTGLPTSITNNGQPFTIGREAVTGGLMDGLIDEAGIWSRELTAGEIAALYNAGSGIPYAAAASGPASLSTRDTIAKASIKTIDGIAIASVKTIDTIA